MEPIRQTVLDAQPRFDTHDITYNPFVYQKFTFEITNQLNDYEVVGLSANLGGFTVTLKILNCDKNSPLLSSQNIGQGQFGTIFRTNFLGESLAIKSIRIPFHLRKAVRQRELARALK